VNQEIETQYWVVRNCYNDATCSQWLDIKHVHKEPPPEATLEGLCEFLEVDPYNHPLTKGTFDPNTYCWRVGGIECQYRLATRSTTVPPSGDEETDALNIEEDLTA